MEPRPEFIRAGAQHTELGAPRTAPVFWAFSSPSICRLHVRICQRVVQVRVYAHRIDRRDRRCPVGAAGGSHGALERSKLHTNAGEGLRPSRNAMQPVRIRRFKFRLKRRRGRKEWFIFPERPPYCCFTGTMKADVIKTAAMRFYKSSMRIGGA